MKPNCASMSSFPRHLGPQIGRRFIAHQRPVDTTELVKWTYGDGPHPNWHWWNIRRHLRYLSLYADVVPKPSNARTSPAHSGSSASPVRPVDVTGKRLAAAIAA